MKIENVAPRAVEKAEWLKPEVREMRAGNAEAGGAGQPDGPNPNFS